MNDLVFVYGAHRSGTTVFKLMLDSHPDISNPGEVDFMFDHLHKDPGSGRWVHNLQALRSDGAFQWYNLTILNTSDDASITHDFIDQLRKNNKGHVVFNIHRNLDKVAALFPAAKIIHMIRDPRDVASSCIAMGWAGNTYYAITAWLQAENEWDSFGSFFRPQSVLELFYEELISDPTTQLGRVCRFLGLNYSSEMLKYPEHSTYEAPNPSVIQQWKHKLPQRDVALVEIQVRSLLLDRRYALSGFPLIPPGTLEQISLLATHKWYIWKFGCRRFGYYNFIMERITRRLSQSIHSIFVRRMNEIGKQYLK